MKRLQPRVYISTYFRGQNERCAYLPTHVSAMPTYAYPVPMCVFCPICQRPNLMPRHAMSVSMWMCGRYCAGTSMYADPSC